MSLAENDQQPVAFGEAQRVTAPMQPAAVQSLATATALTDQLAGTSGAVAPQQLNTSRRGNSVRRALQFAEPMTPQGLLLAWKRRWRPAVMFGVPIAVMAVLLAWALVPAYYTSYALLKIEARAPRLVFQTAEGENDFLTYRQTQVALIKSRFVVNAALRRPGIGELSTVRAQQFPVQWLQSSITVGQYNSPEILQISMSGDRPDELTAIVNAVKDAYLDEVVLADRKKRIARLNDLERIYNQTEDKVRQKEKRVENLAKQLGTGDTRALSYKQQMALEHFSLLKREHSKLRFVLMQEQIRQQTTAGLEGVGGADVVLPAVPSPNGGETRDPAVAFAQQRISQLKDLISRYETQVVDRDHPALTEYRTELRRLQGILGGGDEDGEAGSRFELLQRQEKLLREELDKYSQLVKSIGTSSFELELMKSEIDQIAKVSDKVRGEMEALRIELQSPTRVTLLQPAEVPQTRDKAKKKKLAMAGGVGTLGLVFLVFAVIEFHARRITDPKDVSQTLGLELMGTLPAMPRPLLKFWKQPKESRLALWNNALIESIDSVRSVLLHSPEADRRRVLMVASASAGEGKTTFACQLAGSLARAGRKTLLIDFDLRRPRGHELLDVPLTPGVSELLAQKMELSAVIHSTGEEHLDIIPAGEINDAALQSIAKDGAGWVFEKLRQDYEFIIVDSSPVLYVADGGSVGSNVDGAVIAVRSHVSRTPAVAVACERIEKLGIPLIGSVMVGVRANLSGYGYSYDYHYGSLEPAT